jgi:spore coat polysaccharide biosynthesis protein SpsF
MTIGVIIQARLNSTRLPNKILLDFFEGKSILEVIYNRLCSNLIYPVIVATTTNKTDDTLVDFCKTKGFAFFRGSEDDVLQRFIDTAVSFKISHIIRVCSDNPFLYINGINALCEAIKKTPNSDYISYEVDKTPSILTHYGFWAELVSLNALLDANQSNEKMHHEHLTNFIYSNQDRFKIRWLPVSMVIEKNTNIRLTVDDINDFLNAQYIYKITKEEFTPEVIVDLIKNNVSLKENMTIQIRRNIKQNSLG